MAFRFYSFKTDLSQIGQSTKLIRVDYHSTTDVLQINNTAIHLDDAGKLAAILNNICEVRGIDVPKDGSKFENK